MPGALQFDFIPTTTLSLLQSARSIPQTVWYNLQSKDM